MLYSSEEIKATMEKEIEAYKEGRRRRSSVEWYINYFKKEYDYIFDPQEYIDILEEIDKEEALKRSSKEHSKEQQVIDSKRFWNTHREHIIAAVVILVLFFGIVRLFISVIDSPDDHSGDAETYYYDENGNGEFDRGEDNYTKDADGNVIDIDYDHSNF